MFEIEGKYTSALLTIDEIEPKTYSQVFELTRKEYLKDCKIVMMPDMHPSKGCVVGTTIDLSNQDIPKLEASLIGTDIGCGVMATWTDQDADKVDFERLDEVVLSLKGKADKDGFGSIGGGNHFIELDRTPDNKVIVVVHSGSRRQGRDVGLRYICKGILQGDDLTGYLSEVERLQNYAKANRKAITDGILRHLGWARTAEIDCPHNYIDLTENVLHKGSIKATEGQPVIIPLNMKDGIIIGIGKGNKTWNSSAPHGAGRLLTRSEANALLELKDYQEMMADIHSLTVNKSTLDESPFVYKEPKMIIKAIEDVVKIDYIATPIYNYKERST